MGVLPAEPDSVATALAEGRDVAIWPGGEIDSLHPWRDRDKAVLGGRSGFVKTAIRAASRSCRSRRSAARTRCRC